MPLHKKKPSVVKKYSVSVSDPDEDPLDAAEDLNPSREYDKVTIVEPEKTSATSASASASVVGGRNKVSTKPVELGHTSALTAVRGVSFTSSKNATAEYLAVATESDVRLYDSSSSSSSSNKNVEDEVEQQELPQVGEILGKTSSTGDAVPQAHNQRIVFHRDDELGELMLFATSSGKITVVSLHDFSVVKGFAHNLGSYCQGLTVVSPSSTVNKSNSLATAKKPQKEQDKTPSPPPPAANSNNEKKKKKKKITYSFSAAALQDVSSICCVSAGKAKKAMIAIKKKFPQTTAEEKLKGLAINDLLDNPQKYPTSDSESEYEDEENEDEKAPPPKYNSSDSDNDDSFELPLSGSAVEAADSHYQLVCWTFRKIQFFDLSASNLGSKVRTMENSNSFYSVTFPSSSGINYFCTGDYAKHKLRVWKRNFQGTSPNAAAELSAGNHPGALNSVLVAPNDKFVVTGCVGGVLNVWSPPENGHWNRESEWEVQAAFQVPLPGTSSQPEKRSYDGEDNLRGIINIAITSDSRTLAAVCGKKQERVALWDLKSRTLSACYDCSGAFCVGFSRDNRRLAAGTTGSGGGNKEVFVWRNVSTEMLWQDRKIVFLLRDEGKCKGKIQLMFAEWTPLQYVSLFL